MTVRIIETNEIKELGIIDPVSCMDYVTDFIGNTGAMNDGQFTWYEDDDLYEVSREDLEWWENVIEAYQKSDFAQYNFKQNLDSEDRYSFENDILNACSCDLEDMAECMNNVVEEWKNK